MLKKLCFSMMTTALLVSPAMSQETAPTAYNCDYSPACEVAPGIYGAMNSPVMSKFNLSIGGYVKLDYAHNTNDVGPASPGAPGGGLPAGGSKDESIFTAKQTRFWFKVSGPTFLGAKTNALVEADFYGIGSNNEFGNLRMRHAYGSLDWTNTQVLFGQYWDIFGPAAADTIDFRQGGTSGAPNNPRVPQVRLTQTVKLTSDSSLKLVIGAQNPVQDAASAGDGSMSKTNGFGSSVNGAGQIIYSSKVLGVSPGFMGLGMSPLQVGIFGLAGSQSIVGNHDVNVHGYGAYVFVPIIKSKNGKNRDMTLSLEGQAYVAAGLDVQGATAVATIGNAPNMTAAKGFGYYGQLKFYPIQELGITGGYMRRSAINYASYRVTTPAFEKYNEIAYGNITYDLNAAVRVATEFEHNVTQYGAKPAGTTADFGQNNIVRVAVYYFF